MKNIHEKILDDYDGTSDSLYWKTYKLGIMTQWESHYNNNAWWELNEHITTVINHYVWENNRETT